MRGWFERLGYYLMVLASSRHVSRSNLHVGAVTTRRRMVG